MTMYGLKVDLWSIFVTLIALRMDSVKFASADCDDPGTPTHGSRKVSKIGSGSFPVKTIISFSCNDNYLLRGSKVIQCQSKNKWYGKLPKCISQECTLPPPAFAHANVTSLPVPNRVGNSVEYACHRGYTAGNQSTSILCDKDPSLQGVKWTGNFTCKKKTCGHPPSTDHGNFTFDRSTWQATYYCLPGFSFLATNTETVYRRCSERDGEWPSAPTCVKICSSTDVQLQHGDVNSNSGHIYKQGTVVTFVCNRLYSLKGSSRRRCLSTGVWGGTKARCVRSECEHPAKISHGSATSNSSRESAFPLYTRVTYKCHEGFMLVGPKYRQCRPSGEWSGTGSTKCEKTNAKCGPPPKIEHGFYSPNRSSYKVNAVVSYLCYHEYYFMGRLPHRLLTCSLSDRKPYWTRFQPEYECLPLVVLEERCREAGKSVKLSFGYAYCDSSTHGEYSPTSKLTATESRRGELDKMTIVVATAGSTLGALVIFLTASVCFRRFHRTRRFRRSAFRNRRCSDDDRLAIIAAYTGDVHFILPSYDEAISEAQNRPPPSFESVVPEGRNRNVNNQTSDDPENCAGRSASVESDPAADTRVESSRSTSDHLINIARNPLAESRSPPTSAPSVNLPSSSSEEDLAPRETRPLLDGP